MEADMRKPIHGMMAGASVATALAVTVVVAAAQAPAPQFDLTKVTDHVYSFRSGIHRAMVVVTSDGLIATDPINSMAAKNMMDEIRKVTDKPVKFVITTIGTTLPAREYSRIKVPRSSSTRWPHSIHGQTQT